MRALATVTVICLSAIGLSQADPAAATIRQQISVAPQALEPALRTYAAETGLHVIYISEDVRTRVSAGATGRMTPGEALTKILNGTGLTYRFLDASTISIIPGASGSGSLEKPPAGGSSAPKADGGGKKEAASHGSFRMAQLARGQTEGGAAMTQGAVGQTTATLSPMLGEVVVTAEKRSEPLLDVPVPVTAISARALVNSNLLRLQDYYNQVPSLTVTPSVNGLTSLTIRGITSGGLANPTVAVTIDDVPIGTSNITAGGLLVPDLDPSDLDRIEVLRGPQGTLYGASSLGGLLKYVTVDPSTTGVSGRAQVGVSGVYKGNEPGYNVRGSVNVPINDSAAFRVSAFHRRDPGYIDDVRTGRSDVNGTTVDGGHLSVLLNATPALSVKFGALLQQLRQDGSSDVDVPTSGYPQTGGLGDLQQTRVAGTGWTKDSVQLYSATIKDRMGPVELTSVTGYAVNSERNSLDYTYLVGPLMAKLYGVSGAPFLNHYFTTKVSQELRASMPIGSRIDWLLGGFYTSERTHLTQDITAANPSSGEIVNSWSDTDVVLRYKEYAAFTDFTLHLTDRFDLQLGGRESDIDVPFGAASEVGARFGGQVTVPANESKANAFTYLITPDYKLAHHLMVYARLASGYRPGAPNTGAGVALGVVPSSYAPDKTRNYEVGLKGDLLDHRLSIDTSLYYIDWRDIQLTLISAQTGQSYIGNAGAAKSEGVELSSQWSPVRGLTFGGWVTYNEAVLTQAFPKGSLVTGMPGSVLPTTARWSGNLSVDERFPITEEMGGFVGGSLSYVGNRSGAFLAAGQSRASFPAYAQLNLNAGVRYAAWTFNLYADNVADRRGVLNGGAGYFPPFGYGYIVPRTVGVNVARGF